MEGEDQIPLQAVIEYKDNFNKGYKEEITIPMKVYSNREAKSLGLKQGGNTGTIIIIIAVVLVAAYFIYKRKTKSKDYKEVYKRLFKR